MFWVRIHNVGFSSFFRVEIFGIWEISTRSEVRSAKSKTLTRSEGWLVQCYLQWPQLALTNKLENKSAKCQGSLCQNYSGGSWRPFRGFWRGHSCLSSPNEVSQNERQGDSPNFEHIGKRVWLWFWRVIFWFLGLENYLSRWGLEVGTLSLTASISCQRRLWITLLSVIHFGWITV